MKIRMSHLKHAIGLCEKCSNFDRVEFSDGQIIETCDAWGGDNGIVITGKSAVNCSKYFAKGIHGIVQNSISNNVIRQYITQTKPTLIDIDSNGNVTSRPGEDDL